MEVKYTGQDTINVILKENVKMVDEVVITGIYTRKREFHRIFNDLILKI